MPTRRLLLVAALLVPAVFPAEAAGPVSDSATSQVKITFPNGVFQVDSTNRSFAVVQYWPEGKADAIHLLLREEVASTLRDDSEAPVASKVSVTAWRIGADGSRTQTVAFSATGDTGAVADLAGNEAYYRVVENGCCGALDRSTFFSLESGQALLSITGEPATLEVPNAGGVMRIAGVLPSWAADRDGTFADRKEAVAIVTYAGRIHTLQRALLKGPPGQAFDQLLDQIMSEPTAMFSKADGSDADTQFTLWSADGKHDPAAITDALLTITFTPDYKVQIPVVKDSLDLAHAVLPKGFTLGPLTP